MIITQGCRYRIADELMDLGCREPPKKDYRQRLLQSPSHRQSSLTARRPTSVITIRHGDRDTYDNVRMAKTYGSL